MTTIEWTHPPGYKGETWNNGRGCRPISPGCSECYAMRMAGRQSGVGKAYEGLVKLGRGGWVWTGEARSVPEHMIEPMRWREPRCVFVDSMSDLFFEGFDFEHILATYDVMAQCPHHIFIILTKRPGRMVEFYQWLIKKRVERKARARLDYERVYRVPGKDVGDRALRLWPLRNVWVGVSVEDQLRAAARIPLLYETPAVVRAVSYEPALEQVSFAEYLSWEKYRKCERCFEVHPDATSCGGCGQQVIVSPALDWLIVGGESGGRARPFDLRWALNTIAEVKAHPQCNTRVAVFMKQVGDRAMLDGKDARHMFNAQKGGDPKEWPEALRVREFPFCVGLMKDTALWDGNQLC